MRFLSGLIMGVIGGAVVVGVVHGTSVAFSTVDKRFGK